MSTLSRQTVHVIEGDKTLRDQLVVLIESVELRAAPHKSGWDFLDKLDELSPIGCVALNVQLPGVSGLEVLRALRENGTDEVAIAMSDGSDVAAVVEAFNNGAHHFLARPFSNNEFLDLVQRGLRLYTQRQNQHKDRDAFWDKIAALSPRRKASLSLTLAGTSNIQTAEILGISVRTVEAHRMAIYRELQIRHFSQLVVDATRYKAKEFLRRSRQLDTPLRGIV